VKIDESWKRLLESEFNSEYFKKLISFIKEEYSVFKCYPKGSEIFNAFDCCPINKLKVVIIGQDPYHGINQANGLCFSVNKGISHPPSLINILKEIENDLNFKFESNNGDLSKWANQGVMLLNATLTVREALAGSHQNKGWEIFTDKVIEIISNETNNTVFLLWGSFAKKKRKLIDVSKHKILESGHPSPLSANRGYWFGNKHFSKCNEYLDSYGKKKIDWSL
jgi:uracil-DNA glycosylase|tara:strand:- start:348 stop:1016 length:669 start_codon:yes stop_codon:yes gene_type:complete